MEFAEHISVVDEDGGTGIHELTGANGTIVRVQSREMKSTLFTDGQGALIGEAERGDETTVCDAQGATVFRVVAHPDDAKSTDAFRALLVDAAGTEFCSLDIIRRAAGWSIGRDLVPSRGSLRKLNDRLPKLEVWPSMPNAHRLNFESNSTPNA